MQLRELRELRELRDVLGVGPPLWPQTGVALACLLLLGVRCWPGVYLGSILYYSSSYSSFELPTAAAISLGITGAQVFVCLLLSRVGFRIQLDRLRDILALILIGAIAGPLISATVGISALRLILFDGLVTRSFWSAWSSSTWYSWSQWWIGGVTGVLLVTPLVLLALARAVGASASQHSFDTS